MAPKTPRNKKVPPSSNVEKNASQEPAASVAINYGEVQLEEIEVLQAIYMEDFEEVEVKTVWSTTTDRSFNLKLRSFTDPDDLVVLAIRLTATYPKTVPLLAVEGLERYHERTQKRIHNIIQHRPKALLGEVMIHTIANEIQDALEDAVQARQQGALPSLEDERASAEEVATASAKQAEEAEARRQTEAREEEDRVLKQMVDEEITRRESRKPAKPTADDDSRGRKGVETQVVSFDQPATFQIDNEIVQFNETMFVSSLSKERGREVFLAKPLPLEGQSTKLVVVKRIDLRQSKSDIMELEENLAATVKVRHAGLLSLFAFRIDKLDDLRSDLVLCTEYADRGTLLDLLSIGSIDTDKARRFTIELLEGLECLHRNGSVHGRLDARHVRIVSKPVISVKIAGFGFAWSLMKKDKLPGRWVTPEACDLSTAALRKSDIWQFGEVVAQMFLGLDVVKKYNSPQMMLDRMPLSDSFDDLLRRVFLPDPKKRPSAFDILTAEFLRTNDPAVNDPRHPALSDRHERTKSGSFGVGSPARRRSRPNSSAQLEPMSRYATDFTEIGRLGRGGFGEVVKARNKLDGGVYAIKKIKQAPQLLDQVISEVMLLNRLSHPYVVRYFTTWIEEDFAGSVFDTSTTDAETTTTDAAVEDDTGDGSQLDFGYQSTGGLDFLSSSGFPHIEFGNDSEDESSDEENGGDEESDDDSAIPSPKHEQRRSMEVRSSAQRPPSTLYIQMEYCERHTLRDLVRKTMAIDETWRFVRQITEGLAHIHGHGIIHRDLKPDNVFIDIADNPKIGDFGLATPSQQLFAEKTVVMSGYSAGDITRSVGTALYVAPELRSASGISYNQKVDMYSLGIIFYEMCEPFATGMERVDAIQRIREKGSELPSAYQPYGPKAAQGKLISRLISHKPSERPSSTELLRSDMLPVKIEDETIRKALSGLSDPRSPYHQKMMSALFTHDSANETRIKALAWDARSSVSVADASTLRLRAIARDALETVFRRHGAEEARRPSIFPKSAIYTDASVVQLLDASGNLLQLPYDLVLPHARQLARQSSESRCTFTFGKAYRDAFDGGPPRVSEEVDLDITNNENDINPAFNDAEVIKIMDEVISEMPLFATANTVCFHLNHSGILDAVLGHCRVARAQQTAVKEIISKLGSQQHPWSKIRVELRKFGLPDTTLDDIHQFDFRDVPDKAFARLTTLLRGANGQLRTSLETAVRSLGDTIRLLSALGITRKTFIAPLSSVHSKFYEDGLLFQCVLERKFNLLVIAAGGRYDSLIKAHRPPEGRTKLQGCVGVSIALDSIVAHMARSSEAASSSKKAHARDQSSMQIAKRCDVLVSATGTEDIELAGVKLLATLWDNHISAELANGQTSRNKDHHFTVVLKHEASNTVKVTSAANDAEEIDVAVPSLVSYLQQELRDRESTSKARPASLLRQASQPDGDRKSDVHVLMARHGSKKSNKYGIVSDAQEQWFRKLEQAKDAPILAVETRDDVLDLIQQTRLGDAESWRKAVQGVPLNDRQYVQQIQDMLLSWRKGWEDGARMREACIFNFRTQRCMYYDLGM
ncbi:kinase-like domain-containing protein [Neohortaea acidophila]|uniref:non-specific serine/threonine protein kinase n=1 Tax=Neohortaea acidophila TaxID=245834 RepID=A0A6A6PXT1_9PEZI|nr:kinase-like domain-containing protein [Neohortaea acidophila]KAF2484544.1 kinase-like domain-containing protein [Neohortaea acidophila]